jgi:hypothetical protein
MSYSRHLCLLAHTGVQHIYCVFVLFFFVLCTLRRCSHIDRLRSVLVSSIQFETAVFRLDRSRADCNRFRYNHCTHCSSDSISNRFNFLLSSGHVPSAVCCMADLVNRVLFMLICILNAMIVDFMTRRLLQRRIYRRHQISGKLVYGSRKDC